MSASGDSEQDSVIAVRSPPVSVVVSEKTVDVDVIGDCSATNDDFEARHTPAVDSVRLKRSGATKMQRNFGTEQITSR